MARRRKRRRKIRTGQFITATNLGPIRMEYRWWVYGIGPIKGALPVLEFKLIGRRR